MKVAIVAPTPVPFTRGGAERAWSGLHGALLEAGHDAEVVKLPVRERTLAELAAGYRAFAHLDLTHFDVVISSKYPAWLCPHPRHVLWMFHPLRGVYDTYHLFGMPTEVGPVAPAAEALLAAVDRLPRREAVDEVLDRVDDAVAALGADHPHLAVPSPLTRRVVRWLDGVALAPSSIARHAALSRTIATRADYLPPGVAARVAYAPSDLTPPPPDAAGQEGTHLFTASRLDGPKRLDLLIRAMAHVPGDLPLLIGGHGPEEERLRSLAADDPRIRFVGFVPDDELASLYASARAVPFLPYDEDYGLITVEALAAGTPVVTLRDSGGPAELIRDGVEGLVVEPTPEALGAALASLVDDPARAVEMGAAGRRRAGRITWPALVRTLLGPDGGATVRSAPTAATAPGAASAGAAPTRPTALAGHRTRHPGRLRVVVLTTFRVADRGHGGQLRSFHLYGALARRADVEIVSLTRDEPAGSVELAPGLVETAVPISAEHQRRADEMSLAVGLPVSDLASGSEIRHTPEYLRQLGEAARNADVVILAEPYLLPALEAAGVDLPFVYDAFNVEADLKADVLPPTAAGAAVYERVVAVEHLAVTRAAAITACSPEDAAALAAAGGRPRRDAVVVPNGTDCGALAVPTPERRRLLGERWLTRFRALDPRARDAEALAIFFGSWHPPNLDAVETLLKLAPDLPEVLFVLGGRHSDAFVGRATPPNLVFAGVVSDRAKASLLRAAHLALNPMAFGSGTNLKVLEYLAAGVPVVSTPFGVRGVDVVPGEHLLVAEQPDLADAVRAVVADPEAAAQRAAAGRARVEERYDWGPLGDRLHAVVAHVAGVTDLRRAEGPATPVR